jgi:acyl-CoA synthetase (AMP-forming)/AMP-acid ligase II
MARFISWGQDLATIVDRFGPATAVECAQGRTSFAELGRRAASIAARLRSRGVADGEPVATFLRNGREAVWASYGATLAGAAETPLNANSTPDELRYQLRLAGVRHVLTDAASAPLVASLGAAAHVVAEIDDAAATVDRAAGAPGDAWGRIIFTSGTTGRPKAIVHSHERRWLATLQLRAHLPYQPGPGSRVLLMTPFSHGASLLTFAYLATGASVHLLDGVRVEEVRRLLEGGTLDSLFAPPTVLAKLTAAFAGHRFEGIRAIFCGTATLTPELYFKTREMFGPVVRVTYGKSEVFNPITVLPPAECDAFYARGGQDGVSLGWPAAGVEVAIRDEDGRPVPPGEEGEIHLRAPHMLVGLIDERGFHKLGEDEFHATGDVGRVAASGELLLAGRRHDAIKSGGYKIYPQEIELALAPAAAPGALVAVGLPSAYWGEAVVAVAENAPAGWEERAAAAAESLARPKRPRAYVALPALPRGGQDKVQRARVVEAVLARYRLDDGPHPTLTPRPA